jgi:hypothetical protein
MRTATRPIEGTVAKLLLAGLCLGFSTGLGTGVLLAAAVDAGAL